MSFQWPVAWLLLLPLFLWSYYFPFRGRAVNLLRLALYLVIVAALSGAMLRLPERSGVVVAVADRSASMPEGSKKEIENMLRRLESAQPKPSRLGILSFGGGAVIDKLPDSPGFEELRSWIENTDASNMAGALEAALQLIPAASGGRIVLFSDGRWTGEDPARLFALAAARKVAVDFRPLQRERSDDLSIVDFEAPLTAAAGEFYTLSCRITSPAAQTVRCRIRRGADGPWEEQQLELRRGLNFFSWRDRGDFPGVADYSIEVKPETGTVDAVPENNRARRLVEIAGRKPVLLLTHSPSGNLGRVLSEAGLPVMARRPSPREITAEKLASYAGVILENIDASTLGADGMKLLAGMVKTGALGLMMTGGRSSFAPGGYYKSPLDEILPVSMEQRREERKASLALMVVLDRSGSMAMSIGAHTKMDMANLATAEVLRMLSPLDEFGVVAVDSRPHTVVPLSRVGSIPDAEKRILRIESMGGGIFTYTGLHAGTAELLKSRALTRHLILFADAADAEEPGEYRELLARTSRAGITVSVVGLGADTDSDAEFLKDVAALGNGMIYFSDRADELPRIFAQDTFVMAQNTFVDAPTPADFTAAVRALSASLGEATEFDGYNRCFARENAEVLLVSRDDYAAPLAAIGQAGLGRVSVLTAEADGEYTGRFASDPQAGTLLAALANWMLAPEEESDEYLVTQSLEKGVHRISVHLNPGRERDPWRERPEITTLVAREGGGPVMTKRPMEWVAPDRLEADVPLSGSAIYLSTLSWDKRRPIPLAPAALAYSPEFRPPAAGAEDPARLIADLCRMTGGMERIRVEELWQDMPHRLRQFNLTPWLIVLALLLLLLEVAERRLGIPSGLFRFRRRPSLPPPAVERGRWLRRPEPSPTSRKRKIPLAEKAPSADKAAGVPPPMETTQDDIGEALRKVRRR